METTAERIEEKGAQTSRPTGGRCRGALRSAHANGMGGNAVRYALLCLLLSGCAHVLSHPTKGDAEFDDDLLDCETRAAPIYPPVRAESFVQRCMRSKGWKER